MSEYVVTQDISSGRVHKRYRAESGYATHEADNLDSAGAYRIVLESELTALPAGSLCRRCWPDPELPEWAVNEAGEDDASTAKTDATDVPS